MKRWETYFALLAVILASLSAIKIGGHQRPVLAFSAIAVLAFICYVRLRTQFMGRRKSPPSFDAYERALRIQEERERKYWR